MFISTNCERLTSADTTERQTSHLHIKAVMTLEDDRERLECEVNDPKDEGDPWKIVNKETLS
jgi:hypothetical protein